MKIQKTSMKNLLIIETDVFVDNRGWFSEVYTKNKFFENKIDINFVQDNQSYSLEKGTLRGIHFQSNPKAQTKLIRCIKGSIIDIVVDLRKGSDTYKQWYSIQLSAENRRQLLIPKGFGHAYLTETDDVEVMYKVDEYYSMENDCNIRFDDSEIGINWGIANPILSQKDINAPLLKHSKANFSIKVLVTGANGQLGHDIVKRLNNLEIETIGVDKATFDISNKLQTEKYILKLRPDVIVHCAAYTNVDKAEEEQKKCYAVNVDGTRYIAEVCKLIDAKIVFISTDYVFEGLGSKPYSESDTTNPINYYGYTKERSEIIIRQLLEKHFIVRTSWLFGNYGNNFVNKVLKIAQKENEISVVNDQFGSPTYSSDLAILICDMLQTTKYGTYHAVNEGFCSWFEFAQAIYKRAGIKNKVIPVTTSSYKTIAKRPKNSRLSKEMLNRNGFDCLPPWDLALEKYFANQEKTLTNQEILYKEDIVK